MIARNRPGGRALLVAAAWLCWSAGPAAGPAPAAPDSLQRELLERVNQERRSRGLSSLAWNGTLAGLAADHARDMSRAGRVSHHSTADGADFTRRLARTPARARAAAENVALARDVAEAHEGLMRSAGHRRNILEPGFGAIGIGIVPHPAGEGIYVVEDFASLLDDLTPVEAAALLRAELARLSAGRGLPAPVEEPDLSRRLAAAVEEQARTEAAGVPDVAFGEGRIFAYTTADPGVLPREAASRGAGARRFALALTFRKSRSYPLGTWWVLLVLRSPG